MSVRRFAAFYLFVAPMVLPLSACGTYVPEIQELPGNQVASQLLVQAIIRSVHCEIRNAVTYVIDQDKRIAALNHGVRSAKWLEGWGVEVALTLTVEEKSGINPSTVWTPPNPATALFSLGGAATLSSDATRRDILNYYYTVEDLYRMGSCPSDANANAPPGSLLIQSDLKLREWLETQALGVGTGEITVPKSTSTPLKQNALSHEVKFEVVSSGSITPAWKLVHVTVNQGGSLLTAGRDRTHDLLMTFGPVDPAFKGQLTGAAAAAFLSSQVGLAVSDNSKAGVLP